MKSPFNYGPFNFRTYLIDIEIDYNMAYITTEKYWCESIQFNRKAYMDKNRCVNILKFNICLRWCHKLVWEERDISKEIGRNWQNLGVHFHTLCVKVNSSGLEMDETGAHYTEWSKPER